MNKEHGQHTTILDGTKTAYTICQEIAEKVQDFPSAPGLAFVLVGEHPASRTYIRAKQRKCQEVGITSYDFELPNNTSQEQVLALLNTLNANTNVHGILVQLPLPHHIDPPSILSGIHPQKDVDGFHPINMGKLFLGQKGGFWPCTPFGIVELLRRHAISVESRHVVILGRSNIVGKPLAALFLHNAPGLNATVTVTHRHTKHLHTICQSADVLVAAIGSPHFVRRGMVQEGAIVLDVGINRLPDRRILGDVAWEEVAPLASYITPVPGGIGPMTIAMLLHNTCTAYIQQRLHQ